MAAVPVTAAHRYRMTDASGAAKGSYVARALLRLGHLVHSGVTRPQIESRSLHSEPMDLPNCFAVAYFLGHKVGVFGIDFRDALLNLLDLSGIGARHDRPLHHKPEQVGRR